MSTTTVEATRLFVFWPILSLLWFKYRLQFNTVGPDWQMLVLVNVSIAKCSNRQKSDRQKFDWHLLDYQIFIRNFKAVFLLNIQKQFKAVFLSNLLKQKAVSGRISAKVQPAFAWLPNLHKQFFCRIFRTSFKQFPVDHSKSLTGKSLTGKSLTGKSLTGKSLTGKSPTGKSPTGKSPTGKSPTGKSTTGKSPTGKSLTGICLITKSS